MCQAGGDARAQIPRHRVDEIVAQIATNDVAAERERQSSRFFEPPGTFVEPKLKAAILVRQLTFVNQQACVDLAAFHGLFDLIERHHYRIEVGLKETEDQVSGGELSRHGDVLSRDGRADVCRSRRSGNQSWTVLAIAHGRAVRKDGIGIRQVCVGMYRHSRHFEFGFQRSLVECFDVRELVHVLAIAGVDHVTCQRPEHESVVGIRAMSYMNCGHQLFTPSACCAAVKKASIAGSCAAYSGFCNAISLS